MGKECIFSFNRHIPILMNKIDTKIKDRLRAPVMRRLEFAKMLHQPCALVVSSYKVNAPVKNQGELDFPSSGGVSKNT